MDQSPLETMILIGKNSEGTPIKVTLQTLPEDVTKNVAYFFLLFSQIEYVIANIIILGLIPSNQHETIKGLNITQEFFKSILNSNFERKLGYLKEIGLDKDRCAELKAVQKYRNALAHGSLFKDGENIMAKLFNRGVEVGLSVSELINHINQLEDLGGHIFNFAKEKGYNF